MRIELILVRDPDGGTDTTLFLDGELDTDYDEYEIDAGRGYTWQDWTEHRDWCLAHASSSAVRAALADAFTDPPGSDYLDGRQDAPWLPALPDNEDDDALDDPPASDTVPAATRHRALNHLIDAYHGDATVALLALARHATIAVAYLDRAALQAHLGRTFTDPEWQQISAHLDSYDEWLDHSGAAASISYWISDVLLPAAGIDPDPDAGPDPGAGSDHEHGGQ
jgi:hypothetical protein